MELKVLRWLHEEEATGVQYLEVSALTQRSYWSCNFMHQSCLSVSYNMRIWHYPSRVSGYDSMLLYYKRSRLLSAEAEYIDGIVCLF